MTKGELLTQLRDTRAEWDSLLAQFTPAQLAQPNTVEDWSVKDVIFHCTRYANVYVHALQRAFANEPIASEVTDRTPLDERNQLDFQASQRHSLEQVLTEARAVFERLIALVEAQPEAFLIEPQQFEGVNEPVIVWQGLAHTCNHYRGHMQAIRSGLTGRLSSESNTPGG